MIGGLMTLYIVYSVEKWNEVWYDRKSVMAKCMAEKVADVTIVKQVMTVS